MEIAIGIIVGLVVLAMLFGKRIEKKWEFDADFHDERGREIGEFEVELTRIAKEEEDFTLRAKLKLRHPALQAGSTVEVHLEGVRVMEGPVEQTGYVRLRTEHLCGEIKDPAKGQTCSIHYGGAELLKSTLYPD